MRIAPVVIAVGCVLATVIPSVPVALVGFFIGGIGTSVLFPQLYDRAARWPGPPGSGFASMLIGQRGMGIITPFIVGGLANSASLDVGQAMAIVILPSAAIAFATTFARREHD
jgi:hypothetical protein